MAIEDFLLLAVLLLAFLLLLLAFEVLGKHKGLAAHLMLVSAALLLVAWFLLGGEEKVLGITSLGVTLSWF